MPLSSETSELTALFHAGHYTQLESRALRLIDQYPDSGIFWKLLGASLLLQGKNGLSVLQQAAKLLPEDTEAHYNLGNGLSELGQFDGAVVSYRRALDIKPDFAEAHYNLGNALSELRQFDGAVVNYRRALDIKPDYAEAHYNLGNALSELRQLDGAVVSYRQALDIKPDYAEAHYNLGNALSELRRLDAAVANYRQALALRPDYPEVYNNLGLALGDRGQLDEALESFRKALACRPDYAGAYNNLQFVQQFVSGRSSAELLAEARVYAARFEVPLQAFWQPHRNTREPMRRLRIGYVSPDFRRHAVAYFIEPILAHHDKNHVEVFCYYNHAQRDDITERIAGYADHWVACNGMTDDQLADRIRADGIDILVDLAGHTADNRLLVFARKPAPVQMTYLGYPGTTGLSGMDYRLTDAYADPEGSEVNYSEQLLRLPHSLWCYRPEVEMPEVTPLPALEKGYITFGSFNNANKIDEPCVELWAALLRELPSARLLLVTVPEGEARERLARLFAARGVGPDRLTFQGKLPSNEFFRMLRQVDVTLDPVSVNGATTTCESLWLGVPVISLKGDRFASRAGVSILTAAKLEDWIARSESVYIALASKWAGDLDELAKVRLGLRAKLTTSALLDGVGFTRNLERFYRNIFIKWCDSPRALT